MRRAIALGAVAALLLPQAAAAHQGNPSYRSIVDSLTPAVKGLTLRVLNYDDRFELTNHSGQAVTVQGYDGEPYARVLADGTVELNKRSPAYYLDDDRFADVKVPASADPKAPLVTVAKASGASTSSAAAPAQASASNDSDSGGGASKASPSRRSSRRPRVDRRPGRLRRPPLGHEGGLIDALRSSPAGRALRRGDRDRQAPGPPRLAAPDAADRGPEAGQQGDPARGLRALSRQGDVYGQVAGAG
jgi:hypothetical protein